MNASVGTSLFFGDIKQYDIAPVSNYNNEWRAAGSLMLSRQISPIFGVRGQFLIGQLSGTRREWTTYFTSNYFDLSLNATINLRNIITDYNPNQFWNAYVILGVGIINYNTEVKDLQTDAIIRKVGFGNGSGLGGSTMEGILTGGLGLDFRLNKKLMLNLETSNRIMNSDMLDGRESGFKYDIYNYTAIGISYRISPKKKAKKTDDYSFFESEKEQEKSSRDKKIQEAEYDTYVDRPVQPPEVDILVIDDQKPVTPPTNEIVVIEKTSEKPVSAKTTAQKEAVSGIEYRVQIRAKYNKTISIQHLSNTYNIPAADIHENMHNGFYIYTVGSYSLYDQARERRNIIRTNNGVRDAFVVAFNNGKRLDKLP